MSKQFYYVAMRTKNLPLIVAKFITQKCAQQHADIMNKYGDNSEFLGKGPRYIILTGEI